MTKRPEKKSETIEVRVSYSEKLAFMEACKNTGTTASHAIRGYIGDFLNPKSTADNMGSDTIASRSRVVLLLGAGIIILSAIVAVSMWNQQGAGASENSSGDLTSHIASSPPASHPVIAYFDANNDGVIGSEDMAFMNAANADALERLIQIGDKNADDRLDHQEMVALAKYTLEVKAEKDDQMSLNGSQKDKQVLIFPPGLNARERRAYLSEVGADKYLSKAEIDRITKIVDVLTDER
jgi:hypothetical protein